MLNLINVYSLVVIIAALFWYYCSSTFNQWKRLNVIFKKPVLFFGNVMSFSLLQQPYHEMLNDLYRYFGDEKYGGFFQMRDPVLMVKDPQLVNLILVKDVQYFYNRGFMLANINKVLNPLSTHLFFANDERWKALRQKMSPVFTSGKLKYMYEQIFNCATVLMRFLEDEITTNKGLVNVKDMFERFTIDVIGSCAFGLECNSLQSNDEFRSMGVKVFKPSIRHSIRLILSVFSPKLLSLLKITDFPKDVNKFFINVVLDTISYRRKNNVSRNDFLQLLMELQNSSIDPKFKVNVEKIALANEKFDEIDVAANSFLFFAAGFETTASTLSFCLYELALNDIIQTKLRNEVKEVHNKYNGKLTPENLKELTYMDMVVTETLRKYPPLPMLNREVTKDYVIPNTKVRLPLGTKILIPVWSIQHDYKYFSNPELFDPERFALTNKHDRINGTYMPFGDGPRYCLGSRFALVEIKVALVNILCKYHVSPCYKTEIPLKYKNGAIMMATKEGIWLKISKILHQ